MSGSSTHPWTAAVRYRRRLVWLLTGTNPTEWMAISPRRPCGSKSTDGCLWNIRESPRRGRDSNPRYGCPYNGFRDRPDRPLRHLSAKVPVAGPRGTYISVRRLTSATREAARTPVVRCSFRPSLGAPLLVKPAGLPYPL